MRLTIKHFVALIAVMGWLGVVQGQEDYGDVLDVELQAEIAEETGERVRVERESSAAPSQKVLILQNQPHQQIQEQSTLSVQQQPLTMVEASPLTDSRAERLRRARQQAEVKTEQKIVEKLEDSRLKDEQRRAEALFGDRLNDQPVQVQETVQVAAPVVQTVPIEQEMAEADAYVDKDLMRNEIVESVKADLEAAKQPQSSYYISGQVGYAEYPDAWNIESNVATGVSIGAELNDGFIAEGTFMYSNHYIDEASWSSYYLYKEMKQYNIEMAVKYTPLTGRFRPLVGALAGYTYRKYSDKCYSCWGSSYEDATSNAFDVGLMAGLDVRLSDSFSIGADYRYIMNLTNQSDSRFLNRRYRANDFREPVEEMDYNLFTLSGKIHF